jgi:hypothetical protein
MRPPRRRKQRSPLLHSSDAQPTLLLRTRPTIPIAIRTFPPKRRPMTIALILNVVLATVVIVAIVGMLSWSIATQDLDAPAGRLRSARRLTTARAQLAGRTVEHRE